MKYDVTVTVRFEGVEADTYDEMQEKVDIAMGCGAVLFPHPTTAQDVEANYTVREAD
jgi:hypothetical protein